MRRPLTRYIAVILLLYIIIGSLYIFGLFNLHLFSKDAKTPSADIRMTKLTMDSYPTDNNEHLMDDELSIKYELEDESNPDINGNLAIGASAKWKKTLLECSRIKKDVRTLKTQLASQYQETDRLKYLLDLATNNPKCALSYVPPKQKSSENIPNFLIEEYIEKLDPSSIYCIGTNKDSRTCHVKNLYYHIHEKQFFIIQGASSEFIGVPNATQFEAEGKVLVDLTSLQDHGAFIWTPEEVAEGFLNHPQSIYRASYKTVMMSRFVPGNTMHAIHDDILGYYYLLRRWTFSSDGLPFDGHHHVLFLDDHGESSYSHLYKYFTLWPLRYKIKDLEGLKNQHSLVLFNEAIIGNSKEANWYQYGFSEPQGPIPGKSVSGHKVRAVASFLMMRMKLPLWNATVVRDSILRLSIRAKLSSFQDVVNEHMKDFYDTSRPPTTEPSLPEMSLPLEHTEEPCIAIFSRRGDRLMLNEKRLALALNSALGLPVYFVRNEDLSFKKQVSVLRRSIIAIGMHGSLLIMGMFLPPGALLIELYPLYVPNENYTPYKTMAGLPGMNLWYGAWSNSHPQLNIQHPEYPAAHGGLETLSDELRNRVLTTKTVPKHLCCTDPFWLFRIYQDTYVHIPEILTDLISPGLAVSNKQIREGFKNQEKEMSITPAKINIDSVKYHWTLEPLILHLEWEQPWNVPTVKRYGVWVHQTFTEYDTNRPMIDIMDIPCSKKEEHIWIRSYYSSPKSSDDHSDWSKKIVCLCPNK